VVSTVLPAAAASAAGVDLVPIRPVRGAKTFVCDITSHECRQLLKREAAGSLFDVVVHDGAPNVGGAWTSEAYTQVRS
jgi:AdoMet-dependent rRNA methyltransferase SPB1